MKIFVEVILSKYFYFARDTVSYFVEGKFNEKELIGKLISCPFGKKEINGIIFKASKNPPENLDEEKIKKISGFLPERFFLPEKNLKLLNKIGKYYFSPLSKTSNIFIPKNVFSPTKKALEEEISLKNNEIKINKESIKKLTENQQKVFDEINSAQKTLLFGITGAGKTEIYKHLVLENIKKGKQSLILLPEIILTPQFLNYFTKTFEKEGVGVVHSKISPVKKAEIWHKIKNGDLKIIIGSRSSLFLPWKDLGLICIDEAHEWTYKSDKTPKYNTLKCAEFFADEFGAKLVLGTATPNVSDYFYYQKNYQISFLTERINKKPLPKIELFEMKSEENLRNKSLISLYVKTEIKKVLEKGEQVILFLNRRGMNSGLFCQDCKNVKKCKFCDVSMAIHRKGNLEKSMCHQCGKIENVVLKCDNCGSKNVKKIGTGTQKIEEEINQIFKGYKIFRVDRDSVKTPSEMEDLNKKLQNNEIDILIGTQMIAKGFDVQNVSLVCALFSDFGFFIPEFSAGEKVFQNLTQLAGRAGRGGKEAKVVFQTFDGKNKILNFVKNYDYKGFYENELENREMFKYPPLGEILKFSLKNKNLKLLQEKINEMLEEIKKVNEKENLKLVIQNAPNYFTKISNEYIWHITLKGEIEKFMEKFNQEMLLDFLIERS